jgi:hypothetical protein
MTGTPRPPGDDSPGYQTAPDKSGWTSRGAHQAPFLGCRY